MKKLKLSTITIAILIISVVGVGAINQTNVLNTKKDDGVNCPGEAKIAQMLNVTVSEFHNKIKKEILADLRKKFVKTSGCDNPDICVDNGYIVFDCGGGKSYKTDTKLETYGD